MTTDIEIARAAKPQNINKIAEKLGLGKKYYKNRYHCQRK